MFGFLKRKEYKDKKTSFEKQEEEKKKQLEKNNKKFNYNFEDKDKIFKQIYSPVNEPFQIYSEENIEAIKKVENHKIELLPSNPIKDNKKNTIPFDTVINSKNFWDQLQQPKTVPIDRDAGSKIKYEKSKISLKKLKSLIIPEEKKIIEEQKNSPKKQENANSNNKIKFHFSKKKDEKNDKNKKKKFIQIEFESTDIDPKKLEAYT